MLKRAHGSASGIAGYAQKVEKRRNRIKELSADEEKELQVRAPSAPPWSAVPSITLGFRSIQFNSFPILAPTR